MLILIGVTINVALNGGLFKTADEATIKTEREAIYDQIVGAMKLTDNGNINVKGTYDEVVKILGADKVTPTNPTTVEEDTAEVTFTVEGKRGTYTYKIAGTEIIMDPPVEDPIITALNKFKDQSVEIFFEKYDTENKCYRINSEDPELENLELYFISTCFIARDSNTDKDYIISLAEGGIISETFLQPEEKKIKIKDGIIALSNLEDFALGMVHDGYWFGGMGITGEPFLEEEFGAWSYMEEFENNDINAIILSNVEYFNSLDDNIMPGGSLKVNYIYVPVGFEQTIWGPCGEFTFGGKDADDVEGLEIIQIDGQNYYKLPWSALE